jgi:hypothetical protein
VTFWGEQLTSDSDLREALKRRLFARYRDASETLVLEELGLRHGAARVDVVVVNYVLHGYELKSDSDTLKLLPRQARIYSSVLDRVTLIVGPRHAKEAVNMVPEWWGVQLAEMGTRRGVRFSSVRRARNNPRPEALAIAKLLWRDEALDLLHHLGAAEGFRSKPRAAIYARLAETAQLDVIRAWVRHRLRNRTGWRFGVP